MTKPTKIRHDIRNALTKRFHATSVIAAWRTSTRPARLFHYTSVGGLRRIIETKALSATNLRHVNDAQELAWGTQVAKSAIEDVIQQNLSDAEQKFIETLRLTTGTFAGERAQESGVFDAYAFCLTSLCDDLSQWRAYADNGRGYSVGFDGPTLASSIMTAPGAEQLPFGPIVYDPKRQEELVKSVLDEALVQFRADPNHFAETRAAARQAFAEIIPFLKHPSFQAEAEWRLITTAIGHDKRVQWRDHGGRLFPHINMRCKCQPTFDPLQPPPNSPLDAHEEQTCLPIRELWAGPLVPFGMELPALDLLLERLHEPVEPKRSKIPLS